VGEEVAETAEHAELQGKERTRTYTAEPRRRPFTRARGVPKLSALLQSGPVTHACLGNSPPYSLQATPPHPQLLNRHACDGHTSRRDAVLRDWSLPSSFNSGCVFRR
jgi:hypothetical protein